MGSSILEWGESYDMFEARAADETFIVRFPAGEAHYGRPLLDSLDRNRQTLRQLCLAPGLCRHYRHSYDPHVPAEMPSLRVL